MARKDQKEQSLKQYPHRCACGRVAKFRVGSHQTLACTLHLANAVKARLLEGDVESTPVFPVEGQL